MIKQMAGILLVCSASIAFSAPAARAQTTLTVDDDKVQCPAAAYSTIQSAIDAAAPGWSIRVCAGNYNEQLTITKAVSIYGDNGALLEPVTMTANVTTASEATAAAIFVNGAQNVNITGLIVDGAKNGIMECGPFLVGVYYHDASGTVYHNAIRNFELPADLNGCQSGDAIDVTSSGVPAQVTINANSINGYQKNGITASDAGTIAKIQNNVVGGAGRTNGAAQNGIQIGFGARGSVLNNTVANHYYLPCNNVETCTTASTGILIFNSDGVTITGNTLQSNQLSIYVQGNKATVQQNVLANSAVLDGITLAGDNNVVTLNRVLHSDDAGIVVAGNGNQIVANEIGDSPIGILKFSGLTGNVFAGNHAFATFVAIKDPAPSHLLKVQPRQ
jgi:parallel beta-helix repeat protein